jgi:hypothetical protein
LVGRRAGAGGLRRGGGGGDDVWQVVLGELEHAQSRFDVQRGALGQQRRGRVDGLGGPQRAQRVELGEVGSALALYDVGELRAAATRGGEDLEVER